MKQLYSPSIPDFNSISVCIDMKNKLGPDFVMRILQRIKEIDCTKEAINSLLMTEGEKNVSDRKKLMSILRIALTGTNKGFVGKWKGYNIGFERND